MNVIHKRKNMAVNYCLLLDVRTESVGTHKGNPPQAHTLWHPDLKASAICFRRILSPIFMLTCISFFLERTINED